MNTKARSRTKRGTSDSMTPTPAPGATLLSGATPPPEESQRRDLATPMRPPSLSAPASSKSLTPTPPPPAVPAIVEAAGFTPTPPPSAAGSKPSRRPPRSRTSKTPAPGAVASQPPTPTPPPVAALPTPSAAPPVSAKAGSKKATPSTPSRRPRAGKKDSIEPAPRVGLESGGWRKPEAAEAAEPAVSHAAGDVDERFFADGDKPLSRTGGKTTFSDLDEPDLRSLLKNAPGAQKRRERYAQFVRWVVVAGVAVLTAGLVRVAIAKREYQPPMAKPVPTQAAQLTGGPAAPEAPPPATTAAEPPAAAQPQAQTEAAKPAEEPAPAASGTPEENAAAAKLAKKESQHALEVGKTSQSIEAGERAVALDPTDAESWLILGAAYQNAGKLADAKRCFKSCLTLGTHGPKGECAAFPH